MWKKIFEGTWEAEVSLKKIKYVQHISVNKAFKMQLNAYVTLNQKCYKLPTEQLQNGKNH